MDEIQIQGIFISAEHGFIGREPEDADTHHMDSVASVECVAGSGLMGDRFFNYKEGYNGQATFFSAEVLQAVFDHTAVTSCPPWATRRNILISGIDLNELIGKEFEVGGVRFFGIEECAPCRWMDRSIGDGAREFLKGQGGLRVKIISSGTLNCGAAEIRMV